MSWQLTTLMNTAWLADHNLFKKNIENWQCAIILWKLTENTLLESDNTQATDWQYTGSDSNWQDTGNLVWQNIEKI